MSVAAGRKAEQLARKHLLALGYRILEQNWRSRSGVEVDLIARDGDTLCLVEVRARSRIDYGHPLETIDRRKRDRLRRAALEYLQQHGDAQVRFDVIAIVGPGGDEIQLVKAAFE